MVGDSERAYFYFVGQGVCDKKQQRHSISLAGLNWKNENEFFFGFIERAENIRIDLVWDVLFSTTEFKRKHRRQNCLQIEYHISVYREGL